MQDEAKTFKHHVQPHTNLGSQQLLLINLQLDARALVIVFKTETMFIESHQVVFKECFENTNEDQMMSRFSNEVGHFLLLQSSLNHLAREQKENYIISMFCQILEFLYV